MVDSFPALFRFAAGRPGRRKTEPSFCPSVDHAEIDIADRRSQSPSAVSANADRLAGERLADEDEIGAACRLSCAIVFAWLRGRV